MRECLDRLQFFLAKSEGLLYDLRNAHAVHVVLMLIRPVIETNC